MVDLISPNAMAAMEKLFEMQREAQAAMMRAFYGSKPLWMSVTDEGEIVVRAIEPEEFYDQEGRTQPQE